MITILLLAYLAGVALAFKVIKIKPSPVSIAIAAVIGVFLMGGLLVGWKFSAPTTKQMVLRRHVLQVVPAVREMISKVYVEPDALVKKGDPLFEVLPDRFQDAVNKAVAGLGAAKATVSSLEAAVTAAEANVKVSEADTASAKAAYDSDLKAQQLNPKAINTLEVESAKQAYLVAEATGKTATATLKQAKSTLAAARHSVSVSEADVKIANFDLDQCTYRSSVDGQVLNLQINEGTMAASWRFTSIGTVMDLSDTAVLAVFPQNQLKNVKPGNAVELAFKRRPGTVATGVVDSVLKYTGEGQFIPTLTLPTMANLGSKGFLAVRIRLDDEVLARKLPLGAAGSVAIYTDAGKPFHLISKITVRMNAWSNYLPF
jgi:multidrug resistance efflux pump